MAVPERIYNPITTMGFIAIFYLFLEKWNHNFSLICLLTLFKIQYGRAFGHKLSESLILLLLLLCSILITSTYMTSNTNPETFY